MTKQAFDKIATGLREASDVAAIIAERDAAIRERDEARAALATARDKALEESASAIDPKGEPPCDCEGNCYCRNPGDLWALADYVSAKSSAAAIRAMKGKGG